MQTLRALPNGCAEAMLVLNNLMDVQHRIPACGRQVEIPAPPELLAAVAALTAH